MKKVTLTICSLALALTLSAAEKNSNQNSSSKSNTITTASQSSKQQTSSSSSSSSYLKYDFEDGKTTNWTKSSSQSVKVSNSNSYSGTYALSISNDANIEQEIKLDAGTYTISAYAKLVSGNSSDASMIVYKKDLKSKTYSTIATEQIKSSKKYSEVKTTIKLSEESTIKLLFAAGRNTDILVDDIDITRKK